MTFSYQHTCRVDEHFWFPWKSVQDKYAYFFNLRSQTIDVQECQKDRVMINKLATNLILTLILTHAHEEARDISFFFYFYRNNNPHRAAVKLTSRLRCMKPA